MDFVIKNRKIKEEEKEELFLFLLSFFFNDFFKDMFLDFFGGLLGFIKVENDYGVYFNFLSVIYLGGFFLFWLLVEERKLKFKVF